MDGLLMHSMAVSSLPNILWRGGMWDYVLYRNSAVQFVPVAQMQPQTWVHRNWGLVRL